MYAEEIVLVTHADTDTGFAMAHELLAAGHRVVVTAAHPTSLTRILLGQNADRVMAVAADIEDTAQRGGILRRVLARFGGPITRIVDGRSVDMVQPISLQIAS